MHKPIENIRQEWDDLLHLRKRLQKDFRQWGAFENRVAQIFDLLKESLGWDAELKFHDNLPEVREIRLTLFHVFPLGDELVAYNNNASLIFEQRLSGQILVWHLFPQKEHFTRVEGPQARPAGQFRIDQLLQDDDLILFRIETFLSELKEWMLEVLPEPAEEKTAQEF